MNDKSSMAAMVSQLAPKRRSSQGPEAGDFPAEGAATDTEAPQFSSLLFLLLEGKSPGLLATAVERHGVHGWDRYGRFKKFDVEAASGEKLEALDSLAAYYAYEAEPDKPPVDLFLSNDDPLYRFGWLDDELPNFDDIQQQEPAVPRRVPVSEVSLFAIIGLVLKLLLESSSADAKRERFRTQEELIAHIAELKVRGAGKSNLQTVFGRANGELKELGYSRTPG